MAERIRLVAGDTLPNIDITLLSSVDSTPIDVSHANDVILLRIRKESSDDAAPIELTATKTNGGADGQIRFAFTGDDLASSGYYEGEVEITFNGGNVQTVFQKLLIEIRSALE